MIRLPCLEGAARPRKHLRGLTLGEASPLQRAIPFPQRSVFEAVPALVALLVASWRRLDDGAHSALLYPSFALVYVMAKDGGVASWVQPLVRPSHGSAGAVSDTKWPTP